MDNRESTDLVLGLGWRRIPCLFHFTHRFESIGLCILLKASAEAFFLGKEQLITESVVRFVMLFSWHFGFFTVVIKQNAFICKGALKCLMIF